MSLTFSLSQTEVIDSLQRKFLVAKNDEEKIDLLSTIFDELQNDYPEKALEIAIELKERVITKYNRNSAEYIHALNLLGIGYMNLSQGDSSLSYFQQMLEISYELKDSANISKSFNNIGALHGSLGNYTSAIYYMTKSAELDEKRGDLDGALISYINIGTVYGALESIDSARYFLKKSLEVALKNNENDLIATCYMNLGVFEKNNGEVGLAEELLKKALNYAEISNNSDLLSKTYHNLANLSLQLELYGYAIMYDTKALEVAKQTNSLENIVVAHIGLASAYENNGQFEEALFHYKQHKILRDSLDQKKNENYVIEMQEKYMTDQALKENEILSQKNKIQNLEIAKNAEQIAYSRIVIISSIVGLVLLVVLALTLYNRNILKQRANQKLQDAYAIIHEKNADILASIDYASKIQEALLPTKENPDLFKESFFILMPKDIVSGDFIWYSTVGHKKIIATVDCTGHGVPGAFMSMIGNTFLHQIVNEKQITDPAEILNQLRVKVTHALNQKSQGVNRRDGMDMSVCVIDETIKEVHFAGANNPIFYIINGEISEMYGDKQPVGYFEGKEAPFTTKVISYNDGDCIYLFSDGYADQFGGPKGKKFKYKQLKELLHKNHRQPMAFQKETLLTVFHDWKGPLEQVDDVCLIGIRLS